MENRPRYRVPDELRETLLDFTIAYLLERPTNLAEFGLNFFSRLKADRDGGGGPHQSPAAQDHANGRHGPDELEGAHKNSKGHRNKITAAKSAIGNPTRPSHLPPAPGTFDAVAITQLANAAVKTNIHEARSKIENGRKKPSL